MAKPDEMLERIAATARDSGSRSKLYRWLRRNHDAFAEMVEEHRPSWRALAEQFAKEGLTGPTGQPLKADSARRIWYRARRDEAKERAKRAEPVMPVATERPVAPIPAPKVEPSKAAVPSPLAVDGSVDPLEARRTLARLKREMAERSGLKYEEGDQ